MRIRNTPPPGFVESARGGGEPVSHLRDDHSRYIRRSERNCNWMKEKKIISGNKSKTDCESARREEDDGINKN